MKSAVLINSVKGSIRANHYHKTDWHFCYILKGKMEYYFRNTGDTKDPKMIEAISGEMVFTPPMVDHAMKFTEDTSFLTLSKNLRDQKSYEEDVIRIKMIDDENLISWHPKKNG